MPRRSSTYAKRWAEVLALTAILMISIVTMGDLAFGVLELEGPLPGLAIAAVNLALAYVLLRWYHARHAVAAGGVASAPGPQASRFTPAQQAYLANPSARASCQHLWAVEGLMRAQGIEVYPIHSGALRANCRIDEQALRATLLLDPYVRYGEWVDERDRDGTLSCSACQSSITVRHPSMGGTAFPRREATVVSL